MRTCTIEGCQKQAISRGWCSMHYARWQHHGDPLHQRVRPQYDWIVANVGFKGDDCLIWPFRCDKDGYPTVTIQSRPAHATRVMCRLANGDAPNGFSALHTCGKGHLGCINPGHLYWGTQAQNMEDRIHHAMAGGRPLSGRAILTVDQVREIRTRLSRGEPRQQIATDYGVSLATVYDIRSGRSWAFIEGGRAAA